MTRYTSFAGSIARIKPFYGGYAIVEAARVPEPVRAIFRKVHSGGSTEVSWDSKTREATLVPYWERRHI